MRYLVNSREMNQYDHNTSEYYGVSSMVLMERAALAVLECIQKQTDPQDGKALVVCGTGNNGGDGFAIARLLKLAGYPVEALFLSDSKKMTPETKRQYETAKKYQVPILTEWKEGHYSVIVDALFGIGLSREITGELKELLEQLNRMDGLKVAVDIPSGISADKGEVLGTAFGADITVTFGFAKTGMYLYPGAGYCGTIVTADIGIDSNSFFDKKPSAAALGEDDLAELLPKRRPYSNKGSYGKVLAVAGGGNMAGAAYFCGKAAYLTGCGLVKVYTPEENRTVLQTKLPEAVVSVYPSQKPDIFELIAAMKWADVIVAGPGLGTGDGAKRILGEILKNTSVPMVLDADALNIIASDITVLRKPHTELVVTPHLGEMARLTAAAVGDISQNLVKCATDFARTYNVICVLKDARSVIATPNGMTYINASGNDGMATGGSGDVLSGIIAGLIAQGMPAATAAPAGCYLHGLAGDAAAVQKGRCSMTAEDILCGIPQILKEQEQGRRKR